jgi:hypothetical protein
MEVPVIDKPAEAREYLNMLRQTVVNDVQPLLNTRGGAPHAVAREVFCYADYLGRLYTGLNENVGERFRQFLCGVLGLIDEGYRTHAGQLYEMYRNGTVHEFDPKTLTDGKRDLAWLEYGGDRSAAITLPGHAEAIAVTHLKALRFDGDAQHWHLPVSGPCLVDDLIAATQQMAELVNPTKWNEAARSLNSKKQVTYTTHFWCGRELIGDAASHNTNNE